MNTYPLYYEEQTQHGNANFPFSVYEMDAPEENEEKIYCHWHKEVELLYILEGMAVLTLNEKEYALQQEDFVLIPVNQVHRVQGPAGKPFRFVAMVFHPDFISSFGNDAIQQECILPLLQWDFEHSPVLHEDEEIRRILSSVLLAWHLQKPGYALEIKAQIFHLLSYVYSCVCETKKTGVEYSDYRITLIKQMISYIHAHYEETITLEQMAEAFSLSKGHVCRFFREMTHMSLIEYVNYYRINRSVDLLRTTDYSIGAIAEMTGFNTISYFNRIFNKFMHVSPKQIRQSE